ncbi:MAG: hypothetical protein HYX27_19920 [Acidobacteria bacterium]|nr:hypothetical protein [Acidobacteriota bacterium]
MKRFPTLLALLPAILAAEKWTAFRSAPFTIYTNAGEKEAQEALVSLVQLRHTLSEKFGKELTLVWPLNIVQRKNNAEIGSVRLAREFYLLTLPAGPIPEPVMEQLTLLLLKENTPTMDPAIERGVAKAFSTLEVHGPRVTLGAPPKERDLEWSRMQLLLTDPRFSGTAKVLLSNFAKGVEGDAAWRNTVGMLQKDFDKEAAAYLAKGAYNTIALSGKPVDPRRIRGEDLDSEEVKLLQADLAGTSQPTGARALAALDTVESLEKAWRMNPRWSLPHEMLANHEEKASDKAQRYRKAAELSPREVRLWLLAAQAFERAELLTEAAKMWFGAERAAATPAERTKLREERLAADRRRVDAEADERRRAQEAEALELQRLKNEAITRIREAEAKANAGAAKGSSGKPVEWWDGPKPDASVRGKLLRVDCLPGNKMRLAIGADLKTATTLQVQDVGKIIVTGNGTADLGCGLQKAPRTVAVEYQKATKEVSTVTFAGEQ